jgi:hypothetical protein
VAVCRAATLEECARLLTREAKGRGVVRNTDQFLTTGAYPDEGRLSCES